MGSAHASVLLSGDALEYDRLRTLLFELRPDFPDYLAPLPPARTMLATVRVRDPMAGWGDIPRALGREATALMSSAVDSRGARVLAAVRALAPDAAAVLRFLRAFGELPPPPPAPPMPSPRGLYYDVGVAFAGVVQLERWATDLMAKRDGAYHGGRQFVFAAARALGLPIA